MKRGMGKVLKMTFILFCIFFFIHNSYSSEKRNILYINSYHIGYAWSDSITKGIISTFNEYPEYALNIEIMHSKQFGQTKFDVFSSFLSEKYKDTRIDGIIISDNDALDFVIRYGDNLFPDIPITFCGIGNPQDYSFEGTRFYGLSENNNPRMILSSLSKISFIKRMLVISDNSTTGIVYKKEYLEAQKDFPNLKLAFLNKIDTDSLYNTVAESKGRWDAIFLQSLDVDDYGNQINFESYCQKLIKISPLPIFTIHQHLIGKGFVGGPTLTGVQHGKDVSDLLIKLLNNEGTNEKIEHINQGMPQFIFDHKQLRKIGISETKLPKGSIIINKPHVRNLKFILLLTGTLLLLMVIVIVLSFNVHRRKIAEKKIKEQLEEIQSQHFQLEEAFQQLSRMMANLEQMNEKMKQSNMDMLAAKKKAEESDTLKSAFLANVSHEIRTPLNAIVGFSSLLEDSNIEKDTKEEYISYIKSSTASLLVLIDEILDLSRIEAEQLEIHRKWFNLDELLNELYKIFLRENKGSDVSLTIQKPNINQDLYIYSDRVRIQQIFTNLLTNAVKFTEKGSIEMGYYFEEQDGVVFYVKDTGIGIKPEFQPLIFDRFRKIEAHQSKLYRGTGLGLSITQKLTELLDGRIWVDSTYMKGSTFYFTQKGYKVKEQWEIEEPDFSKTQVGK